MLNQFANICLLKAPDNSLQAKIAGIFTKNQYNIDASHPPIRTQSPKKIHPPAPTPLAPASRSRPLAPASRLPPPPLAPTQKTPIFTRNKLSTMITAVIIDDESMARETLRKMLERYFPGTIEVMAEADSVKEGVFAIYKHRPELVFLDIEMPEENGFQLFPYFKNVDFEVIFTTAYKNYTIDAIKVSALHYLLKPISFTEIKEALELYGKRRLSNNSNERINKLISTLNPYTDSLGKIALPTLEGFQMEKVNHILYCEAEQNYTRIHTIRGDSILVSKPLGHMEENLPVEIFFRVHKSYLVNMNFIRSYSKTDGHHIILENGKRLDVATRRNDEFIKALTGKI
jgi:two-component system LytT family response regulator